jgi:uncharacterized protein YeaO (DUF488 family)
MKIPQIQIKRVYEEPHDDDGYRILIDRLWPRGISKAGAQIHYWAKEVAPSAELRKWYRHEADKWEKFKRRYFAELDRRSNDVKKLVDLLQSGPCTFLFASKECELNNAHALRDYMLENLQNRKI